MNPLHIDLTALLDEAQTKLIGSQPTLIDYADTTTLENNKLPSTLNVNQINVYALWSRETPSESWQVMYIGQRSFKAGWARVSQHLFFTPKGTGSKLEQVRAIISAKGELAVTAILVEPDSMRLAVEEELINRNSPTKQHLIWNQKARAKKSSGKSKVKHVG